MSQTLAPSALDTKADSNWPDMSLKSNPFQSTFSHPYDYHYGDDFLNPMHNEFDSGNVTPGDADFASFIDTSGWDEPAAAS